MTEWSDNIERGDRVETHPATDYFMMGVRFGTVISVGPKWVTFLSDGRRFRTRRHNVRVVLKSRQS